MKQYRSAWAAVLAAGDRLVKVAYHESEQQPIWVVCYQDEGITDAVATDGVNFWTLLIEKEIWLKDKFTPDVEFQIFIRKSIHHRISELY